VLKSTPSQKPQAEKLLPVSVAPPKEIANIDVPDAIAACEQAGGILMLMDMRTVDKAELDQRQVLKNEMLHLIDLLGRRLNAFNL
jgi:hypothetical protein